MRRKGLILILLSAFLALISCAREEYAVVSTLETRAIEGTLSSSSELSSFTENLTISLTFSLKGNYSFHLESPDKMLSWEGVLEEKGAMYVTPPISLPSDVPFEEGVYELEIRDENGSLVTRTFPLHLWSGDYPYYADGQITIPPSLSLEVQEGEKKTALDSSNPYEIEEGSSTLVFVFTRGNTRYTLTEPL